MEHLGEQIYHYRTKKGLSQQELAEKLDVSRQSVSKWEVGGAVPDLERLVKMAALFGVTLDELVTGEENETVSLSIPKETTGDETSVSLEVASAENPFPTEKNALKKKWHLCAAIIFLGIGLLSVFFSIVWISAELVMAGAPMKLYPLPIGLHLLNLAPYLICAVLCLIRPKKLKLICAWVLVFFIYVRLDMKFGFAWYDIVFTLKYLFLGNIKEVVCLWLLFFLLVGLMAYTVKTFQKQAKILSTKKMYIGLVSLLTIPFGNWLLQRPTQLWLQAMARKYPDANEVAGTLLFISSLEWLIDLAIFLLFAYCLVRVCATIVAKRKGEA